VVIAMCMQFRPPDPLPEPMPPLQPMDLLIDDILGFAQAWSELRFRGVSDVGQARALVQYEIERLRCIAKMIEDGL
jgi:hypothetical protein